MTIAEYLDAVKTRLMTDPAVAAFHVVRERSTSNDGYMRVKVRYQTPGHSFRVGSGQTVARW